jgi:isopenicillin N synthase-like dioxygenase
MRKTDYCPLCKINGCFHIKDLYEGQERLKKLKEEKKLKDDLKRRDMMTAQNGYNSDNTLLNGDDLWPSSLPEFGKKFQAYNFDMPIIGYGLSDSECITQKPNKKLLLLRRAT